MTDKTNKFDFWEIFEKHDLGIDVHGGNPFSPIWICGMEFGVGVTNFYRFMEPLKKYLFRNSPSTETNTNSEVFQTNLMKNDNNKYECDLAGDTQLIDDNAGEFEYPRLATELIGCLTDEEILNEYKSTWTEYEEAEGDSKYEKLEKFRNISNTLCLKRKYFCANGHGFRMNAFTLSLPNNNDWERTRVYYTEDDWINVKEFVNVDSTNQYKEKHTDTFKKHVKNRLKKYKPRLVICTGKNYFKYFKELFLTENELKIRDINIKTKDREYNFELYCHAYENSKAKTYILLTNFLHNFYSGCIREKDIVAIAEELKNTPELSWTKEIKAPKEFDVDYRIVKILSDTFDKIPDKTLFFYSNEIETYLKDKANNIESAFNKTMNTLDSEWKNRFNNNYTLTNGAKFWILLDTCLYKNKTSFKKIKDVYDLICNEIKKQNIIKIEKLLNTQKHII